ncbi:MAG: DUF4390 domain-containing protein [Desulfovibrionaceae bacterium]|nr:DUF4390 domain-containing protein [Desulfovibrionaceae bacterium]MBR5734867.1 DUF4390 domain-containing protein [Desulfovibrionaceae bacterium]
MNTTYTPSCGLKACLGILILSLLLLMLPKQGLCAESASLALTEFAIETKPNALLVKSALTLNNPAEVHASLRNGAQILLTCTATLKEKGLLYNSTVVSNIHTFLIRHDTLTREFIISNGAEAMRMKKLVPLLEQIWKETPLSLPLRKPLEHSESYLLSLEFSLEYTNVPAWMEKHLLFWPRKVAPTLSVSQSLVF